MVWSVILITFDLFWNLDVKHIILTFLISYIYIFTCSFIIAQSSLDNIKIDLKATPIHVISLYDKILCQLSSKLQISSQVVAGVIIAEWHLNYGVIDKIQDIYISKLLQLYETTWWDQWALKSEAIAISALQVRRYSNKWPIELVKSGYVMSIGFAQITPRTAIHACKQLRNQVEACNGGARYIVEGLLDNKRSIELATAVLHFEAQEHMKETGIDSKNDLALLATIYNIGGDFYRSSYLPQKKSKYNAFGNWIYKNENVLSSLFSCS